MRLLLIALTLAGCNNRPCIKSHREIRTHFIMVGKVMVPSSYHVTVCDVQIPEPLKEIK